MAQSRSAKKLSSVSQRSLASRKIYSWRRLFSALVREDPIHKLLFLGEFFWHMSVRSDLKKELPYLKRISEQAACAPH